MGSPGSSDRARMRTTGNAISREPGSEAFSATTNVPQSAGNAPDSVSYVHECIVRSPASAPAGTETVSSPETRR